MTLRRVSLSFLFVLLLPASLARAQLGVSDLPVHSPETVGYEGDWLLRPPTQGAVLYRSRDSKEIVLSNGLISRTFRLGPNGATVGFDLLTTGTSLLRGVKPEARIRVDGEDLDVGGLLGQPNYAFLRREWIDDLVADPAALRLVSFRQGPITARMAWKEVRHHAPGVAWPPKGIHLAMVYASSSDGGLRVTVHYNLYDGVPLLSKWLSIENRGSKSVRLDSFASEILAAVESSSFVEDRGEAFDRPNIHVETDYAFSGMTHRNTSRWAVHWTADPDYATQVNYRRETPCLLEVRPTMGPGVSIEPGGTFDTFRCFVLPFDGTDRERNGLAQRRMYRVIAPWTSENPLMMHARFADWDSVKLAIDQCAAVGFEMVILTFGSGFNIEKDSPEYLAEMKRYADYAHEKGIELGGYSLLASRSIDEENDVVMPEGLTPTFGNSPCIESAWGQDYFAKLYRFYEATGFNLLEHDGSYPGDPCASTLHPGHEGLADSRWRQWETVSAFYRWCRAEGIYLNVPDYYYLVGSNKCGMGYRETNWSLPRAQQVIHTRQNIFDGTWEKLPSMGWMFVPLTEYHGGGEAATIEPLDAHRDHYGRMLMSNLAMGVQACYRGPRLFDTDATKAMVVEQVAWFREYRDILESDLVHGRRADGRDIDWMLHVNPALDTKGMLVVFNPLDEAVRRVIRPNLYYTGLTDSARVSREGADGEVVSLGRDYTIGVEVELGAGASSWYVIR